MIGLVFFAIGASLIAYDGNNLSNNIMMRNDALEVDIPPMQPPREIALNAAYFIASTAACLMANLIPTKMTNTTFRAITTIALGIMHSYTHRSLIISLQTVREDNANRSIASSVVNYESLEKTVMNMNTTANIALAVFAGRYFKDDSAESADAETPMDPYAQYPYYGNPYGNPYGPPVMTGPRPR